MTNEFYRPGIEKVNAAAVVAKASGVVVDSRSRVIEAQRAAEAAARRAAPREPSEAWKIARLKEMQSANPSASVGSQCDALMRAMRELGSVTCLEAQRFLDIRHPPARILDLTKAGHVIARRWVKQFTERGREHRTMAYCISRERQAREVVA